MSSTHPAETTEAAAEYLMTVRYMHAEGEPVIAARLAERMGYSAASVSAMVTRLVREGLVSVDDQTRQLNLTDAGRTRPPPSARGRASVARGARATIRAVYRATTGQRACHRRGYYSAGCTIRASGCCFGRDRLRGIRG